MSVCAAVLHTAWFELLRTGLPTLVFKFTLSLLSHKNLRLFVSSEFEESPLQRATFET
jgi:hypothetical protein